MTGGEGLSAEWFAPLMALELVSTFGEDGISAGFGLFFCDFSGKGGDPVDLVALGCGKEPFEFIAAVHRKIIRVCEFRIVTVYYRVRPGRWRYERSILGLLSVFGITVEGVGVSHGVHKALDGVSAYRIWCF